MLNRLTQGYATYLDILASRPDRSERLNDAVANGQKPYFLLINSGAADERTLGQGPTRAFNATTLPELDPLNPLSSAVVYASHHLGVKGAVVLCTVDDVHRMLIEHTMRSAVNPEIVGAWQPIKRAQAFITQYNLTTTDDVNRAFALAWLEQTTKDVKPAFGNQVVCCYLNGGLEVIPGGSLEDMWNSGSDKNKLSGDFSRSNEKANKIACSCGDSRAHHEQVYSTEPGEFIDFHTLGAIVNRNMALEAKAAGAKEALVMGHSNCGAINATVNWVLKGEVPQNNDLRAWLEQAKGHVEKVRDYFVENQMPLREKGSDVIHRDFYRFAEMWVTQQSGKIFEEVFGAENTHAHYYRMSTRDVYILNPHATLEETYHNVKHMGELTKLSPDASVKPYPPLGRELKGLRKEAWSRVDAILALHS